METEPCEAYDLEDGEISDCDEEILEARPYTLIERPAPTQVENLVDTTVERSDNDESAESSTDSDDSQKIKNQRTLAKKRKKLLKDMGKASLPQQKKKRNNVWCSDAVTDVLANGLVNCNVAKTVDNSRDVESYDYTAAFTHTKEVIKVLSSGARVGGSVRGKRNHSGHHVNFSESQRRCSQDFDPDLQNPREIAPLTRTVRDSAQDLAVDIANKLMEEKDNVVFNVVEVLGKEKAIEYFEEVRNIEQNGGLLIMNGTRRRTPGGVYFFLVKQSLGRSELAKIFNEDRNITAKGKKLKARERRKIKAIKRREAIKNEDFSTLLNKAEAAIMKLKKVEQDGVGTDMDGVSTIPVEKDGGDVTNPPPSPATDGKDNSSDSHDEEDDGDS